MVSLDLVKASNARIASSLPSGLVAVFVGGTSGLGEYTVRKFAKYSDKARIYIVGRNELAANKIISECKQSGSTAEFTFFAYDVSLLRNVDIVCDAIKQKEKCINVLVQSQGTWDFSSVTTEGIKKSASLLHHSRVRFITNLLPHIRAASSLRRVLNIMAGTKEGHFDPEDIQCNKLSIRYFRSHVACINTLSLAAFAKEAPDVSFIHSFSGVVKSGIAREAGWLLTVVNAVSNLLGPAIRIPEDESGERHLYLVTSAKYPARSDAAVCGVPLEGGVMVATGINAESGSGVYSIDEWNESAGPAVVKILQDHRKAGKVEVLMKTTEIETRRALSSQ
ncbi:hypothetical protein MBLNU457_4452t1 [Dothideomycetes sp. NU457]